MLLLISFQPSKNHQGQCLFDQRLFTDALKKFSIACSIKPDNWSYNMRTVSCMAALGMHEDCLTLVTGCIEQDPQNVELYVLRARLKIKFKNVRFALLVILIKNCCL